MSHWRQDLAGASKSLAFWLALLGALVFFTLPIVWMLATAFKVPGDYVSETPSFLPRTWTLAHFREILEAGFLLRLWNSLLVAAAATALSLALGFLAAYGLVRYRFPARLDLLFLVMVLAVKLMPPIVVALPLYRLLAGLGLLDHPGGLALVYQLYTLPFCIWMLLGFVRDVPLEIEEAALLDHAGLFRRLLYIVAPLCRPGLVATAIFTLVLCWNEFLFALLFLQRPGNFTLPLYIANFITENETLWGQLMAIGALSSLPVLAVAATIQRHLVRGFALGMK